MSQEQILQPVDTNKTGFSPERSSYTCNNVFREESEAVWQQYWLIAGNTTHILQPCSYSICQMKQDAVIVITGNKGKVYARYNIYVYRRPAIHRRQKGSNPKPVCPCHQQMFNRDNTL